MSERAEHTAGPWSHEAGKFGMESVYSEDAGIIAQTYSVGGKGGGLPAIANARLCAAAPDLLHELQEVLEWALVEKAPLREQEIRSIRAAISKATGEA